MGKGTTRDMAVNDYLALLPKDLDPVRLEEDCAIISDPVLAAATKTFARALTAFKVFFDRASDQWLAFPDWLSQLKAGETILAYRLGQPVKRVLKQTQAIEEGSMDKYTLTEDNLQTYREYGIYADHTLVSLVEDCGGDPARIPVPAKTL